MSYTRIKGAVSTTDGYYIGAKGSEAQVIDSSKNVVYGVKTVLPVSFSSVSTSQTAYCVVPFAGNITAVYVAADTAGIAAVYTVTHGSAGNVAATATQTSGVPGLVSTLTLGTVGVTAGESLSVTRGVQGSTAASTVSIVIMRTS